MLLCSRYVWFVVLEDIPEIVFPPKIIARIQLFKAKIQVSHILCNNIGWTIFAICLTSMFLLSQMEFEWCNPVNYALPTATLPQSHTTCQGSLRAPRRVVMEQINGREPAEHLVGRSYTRGNARYHRDLPTRVLPLSHKLAWS